MHPDGGLAPLETLEEAQTAKLELICQKLELEPGHGLIRLWNVYYGIAHFLVTFVALVIHVAYPLAPPRMMPGFVDTHRHIWEGLLRNIGTDVPLEGRSSYISFVLHKLAPAFRPEDAYIGDLVSALRDYQPGDTVDLTVLRNGEKSKLQVNLAERPQ